MLNNPQNTNSHLPNEIEFAKKAHLAVNLGLFANIVLALFKTFTGIFAHSPSLLADGINSTSDVAYYVVVKVFLKMADKPADHEHPYGHRQLENIAAITVGAFIITTAIAIFWDAANNVFDYMTGKTDLQAALPIALIIAFLTIITKIYLTIYTKRVGKKIKNPAITALASDHLNDIMASSAAFIGITFSLFGYYWVDPLAGGVVALFILKTGIEIIKDSSASLMDNILEPELEEEVSNLVYSFKKIEKLETIRSQRFGPYFTLNLIIGINGDLTVSEGDKVADQLEEKLYHSFPALRHVIVHYHPTERCHDKHEKK